MRWTLLATVLAVVMTASGAVAAGAQARIGSALTVCLMPSRALPLSGSEEAAVMAETNAIWGRESVTVRLKSKNDGSCNRLIAVKSDLEAPPEAKCLETALAWVPFVNGRARQIVFLRVVVARSMIRHLIPDTRSASLAPVLLPRLLGRVLAHELGHVLLNSRDHEMTGLMRARYRAHDVLRDSPAAYTLNSAERARLFALQADDTALAQR